MSTKIYNGMKLPNMSVFDINQMYLIFRKTLCEKAQQEYLKFVAKVYETAFIYSKFGIDIGGYDINLKELDSDLEESALLIFAREQASQLISKTRNAILWSDAEPEADFEASLCILPTRDAILCIPCANNSVIKAELVRTLKDYFHAEDYGYWDNTEGPDNITEIEWKKRRDDWNEVLPDYLGVPRQNGIVIKIVDSEFDLTKRAGSIAKCVMPYVESVEVLCKKAAKEKLIMAKYEEYIHDVDSSEYNISIYKAWRVASEYVMDNPENVEILTAEFLRQLDESGE